MKAVLWFFLPGGVLFLASLSLIHVPAVQGHLSEIVAVYPLAVYVIASLFGWRFNRSVLVFGTAAIALSHWCLVHFGVPRPEGELAWHIAFGSAALLLPLNLLALSLFKERGIFTARGVLRLGMIVVQPLLVGMLAGRDPGRYVDLMEKDLLPFLFLKALEVPQIPAAAILVSLVVAGCLFLHGRGARESGLFWALCAVFAGFFTASRQDVMAYFLATACLILLVSIIEVSHAMAFRDELTGLPARRALREDLLKLGSDYCLAMLDIDHFKKFNDRHGHDVGDQVLRMVAFRLAQVEGGGKAFRYGGEEFTVIFPGRCADDALDHLEDLRRKVAASSFAIRSPLRPRKRPANPSRRKAAPKKVSVTISIGAAWPKAGTASPDEVLKAADKALYRAKKKGRNQVST
jgi:diguanylate cyclase (GGDEF)-like protein